MPLPTVKLISKQLLDHLPTNWTSKKHSRIRWKTHPRNHGPGLTASVCEPVCSGEGRCDFVWFAFEEIWGGCCLVSWSFRVFRSFELKKGLVEFHIQIPFCMACIYNIDIHAQKSLEFLHLHKKNYPIPGMCGIWNGGTSSAAFLPMKFYCLLE